MRILLIGEYSGVHNNLKNGLQKLGHEVKLAADGDGFKQLYYDFPIKPFKGVYLGRILNLLYIVFNINKFIGYDVVQFVSPFVVPTYLFKFGMVDLIFKRNKKIIYYACGTDQYYENLIDELDYHPISKKSVYSLRRTAYFNWFIKSVDAIVPATYTYYLGYKTSIKLADSIMLPGSGNFIAEVKKPNEKLKILFGITRREFKGADHIEKALEMIKIKYDKKVEIKIVEKIPFKEYLLLLDQTDILIDQCKSYFYGMNAIFAMERGLIVMSGAEEVAVNHFNLNDHPIVNILPDSDQIFSKLEELVLLDFNDLYILKLKSLSFVKKYHGFESISKQFESIYC